MIELLKLKLGALRTDAMRGLHSVPIGGHLLRGLAVVAEMDFAPGTDEPVRVVLEVLRFKVGAQLLRFFADGRLSIPDQRKDDRQTGEANRSDGRADGLNEGEGNHKRLS